MPPERGAGAARPEAILAALARHEVHFLIVGGVAVQAHGYVRTTVDVDVIPRPDSRNLRRLARALEELEATAIDERGEPLALDLSRSASLALGDYFLSTRAGALDLVNGPHPDLKRYDRLDGNAVEIDLGTATVRVVSKDDLIAIKRASGREQDLADIAALTELERNPGG